MESLLNRRHTRSPALASAALAIYNSVQPQFLITITMRQFLISRGGICYLSDEQVAREGQFVRDRIVRAVKAEAGVKPASAIFCHGKDRLTRKHLHIVLGECPAIPLKKLQEIVVEKTTNRQWIFPAGHGSRSISEEVKAIISDPEDQIRVVSYCLKGNLDNWIP